MKLFSKINFLAVLSTTIAFAQPSTEDNRSIDDILSSAYVEHKPTPVDTTKLPTGPTPVVLDSATTESTTAKTDSMATANATQEASKAEPATPLKPDDTNPIDTISMFPSNMDQTASTDSTASVDSTEEGSSDGIVIYENKDDEKELKERYRRGELVYKYQATAGLRSPSRGIISLEYIVVQEMLNVGVHFTNYNSDYFQFGAALQYFPMQMRYFYMFLGADWIHGEFERERKTGKNKYKEYDETVNYCRGVIGIGGEALFMEHFGMYLELGFEFFAGNGGYYLHMNDEYGTLSNDTFSLPYGIGVIFPF